MSSLPTPACASVCLALGAASLLIPAAGCTQQSVATYAPREATLELPEIQQKTMRDSLRRIFGSPQEPRLLDVDEEAEAAEDSEEVSLKEVADAAHLKHGAVVYLNRCSGCHGVTGDGNGPAAEYLVPRPRDYRDGVFKFTSTPFGQKPARHDLVRTIRRGAKGTSMPAFPWMTDEDLDAVIDFVMLLSYRGNAERQMVQYADFELEEEDPIEVEDVLEQVNGIRASWDRAEGVVTRPVSAEPAYDTASIKQGREIFTTENCFKCHGKDAKGQTEWLNPEFLAEQEAKPESERVAINYDAWKQPAPAADITARMLHGGRRPIDIYRRIATGINGTPMPAFATTFADDPDKIWHLVHYVMHVVDGGKPDLSDLEE